jgi:hypothetical protein
MPAVVPEPSAQYSLPAAQLSHVAPPAAQKLHMAGLHPMAQQMPPPALAATHVGAVAPHWLLLVHGAPGPSFAMQVLPAPQYCVSLQLDSQAAPPTAQ